MILDIKHLTAERSWVTQLLDWYDSNKRNFPWREKTSVYRTWICEVMSQQTTMAVVVPRFEAFVRTIPDVFALAEAPDSLLRELWAGLGYYARARNLRAGARYIVEGRGGEFPQSYEDWLNVPGVGPYTASVIASICFHAPKACVDGNVIRVVARLAGCQDLAIWSETGRQAVQTFVDSVLPVARPGDFNQAMMELGATLCQKQGPECLRCPVSTSCLALHQQSVKLCPPVKPRKAFLPVHLLALKITVHAQAEATEAGTLLIERAEGFLSGTVGFPLLRLEPESQLKTILKSLRTHAEVRTAVLNENEISHTITHHRLTVRVVSVHLDDLWVPERKLTETVKRLLQSYSIVGNQLQWVSKSHAKQSVATSLDRKIWEKMT